MPRSKDKLQNLKTLLAKLDAEAPGQNITIGEWRRRRESAEAQLKELELQTRAGDLLETKDVMAQIGSMIITAKTNLRGIGAKLAPDLAAEPNAAACQQMVDAEIDKALTAISKWRPSDMPAK